MIQAWRILKARHIQHALDGEGARLHGGRWSSRGRRVVHASQSLELAVLEMIVHLQSASPLAAYVMYRLEFDKALVAHLPGELPANWREFPAPVELARLGDLWLSRAESVVLEVPSAVLPTASNYLLNPAHPDFSAVKAIGPIPIDLDPRLFSAS
jgi:RES domain-containing protein